MRIPNNEIWYTTTNSKVVANFDKYAFDSNLISNAYANNRGVLTFDDDITIIGESAFALCEELESITLPDTIVKIDIGAFSACENLKEFNIPDSVKEIGECAFGLCVNLEKFSGKYISEDRLCIIIDGVLNQFALGCGLEEYTIPNDVREIGWSAFSDSELTKINLHENIIKIGHSAFCGCQNLTHINIPNSITTIDDAAFQDCVALKNIFIPKTALKLGASLFNGCDDISVVYEDNRSVTSKNKDLNQHLAEYTKQRKISPESWVYAGNKNAKIIYIPDGVSIVNSEAFKNCNEVEVIYIPDSVKEVENGAFEGLGNLCRFEGEYASDDGRCLIIKNTLIGFAGKDIYEYTLPSGITNIAPMVFSLNKHLCTIDIPFGVRTIGYQAFWGCEKLIKIELPDSINVIGDSAFGGCESLVKIIIPNSVKVIGDSAFQYCTQLEEVTLPDNLFATNSSIFSDCNNLKTINSPLMSKDGNYLIIDGVLVDYIEQEKNSTCVIPNGVTAIARSAFYGNKNITSVVIPQSVTDIGDGAFHSCSNLVSAEFESPTPPEFGYAAFYANARRFVIYVPTGAKTKYKKALKEAGIDVFIFDKSKENADEVFDEMIYGSSYDNKISAEKLLSIGIDCYRKNDIKGAVAVFEKLIVIKGCKDEYPYDILIRIYKGRKDVENEKRILSLAIENLPIRSSRSKSSEYQKRLNTLSTKSQEYKLPTVAEIPQISIKHGDLYEEEIFKLPEFNFYTQKRGFSLGWHERETLMQPIGKIIDYFDELIHKAEMATSRKDYKRAAPIYERIIAEKYWKTAPYDKLIKIYSRAMLLDEEIRVLKLSIEHFTNLKAKRYEYITRLADKYNAHDYIKKRNDVNRGRIVYYFGYRGDITLYEPYPILTEWIQRLEKKQQLLTAKY